MVSLVRATVEDDRLWPAIENGPAGQILEPAALKVKSFAVLGKVGVDGCTRRVSSDDMRDRIA